MGELHYDEIPSKTNKVGLFSCLVVIIIVFLVLILSTIFGPIF